MNVKDFDILELDSKKSELPHKSRPLSKIVKPPFGYFGSKQRIANRILDLLPPHNAWVEAFCGSAAITMAKPRVDIEVINDLDDQVVNLFQILRTRPEELLTALALTPYARSEFDLARSNQMIADELEKARRFLVGTMMTVNGTSGSENSGFSYSDSYTRGGKEARVNRWYNLPERIAAVVERLREVRIENKDARDIITQYQNRPATLIYLDPPYFMERAHSYATDANNSSFHEDLLKRCISSKSMILISSYDNELYLDMLKPSHGWKRIELETSTRGTKGKNLPRTEVLWMNNAFQYAEKAGGPAISLTRKESEQRKINPERLRRSRKLSKTNI